jgi:hypothetical protein
VCARRRPTALLPRRLEPLAAASSATGEIVQGLVGILGHLRADLDRPRRGGEPRVGCDVAQRVDGVGDGVVLLLGENLELRKAGELLTPGSLTFASRLQGSRLDPLGPLTRAFAFLLLQALPARNRLARSDSRPADAAERCSSGEFAIRCTAWLPSAEAIRSAAGSGSGADSPRASGDFARSASSPASS